MIFSVSPEYMRQWEENAFDQGVSAWDLVQNVAKAVCELSVELLGEIEGKNILIVCGPGNNGADGYACARLFRQCKAFPYVVAVEEPKSDLAKRTRDEYISTNLYVLKRIPEYVSFDLVIDSIYGIGFRGNFSEHVKNIVDFINLLPCPTLSVDIPSGTDALTGVSTDSISADATLSLQCHKHGVLLAPDEVSGVLYVRDIGLPSDYQPKHSGALDCIWSLESSDLKGILPVRKSNAHKGDCGRALIIAGSMGLVGAASIAAKACLRGGAGLTTIECDEDIMPILQTLVPEAMCALPGEKKPFDAVLLGCGWGKSEDKYLRIKEVLSACKSTVLDADALNMIAEKPFSLGKYVIITPHLGEAARLLGVSIDTIQQDKLKACLLLHEKYQCSVLLKDAVSVLFDGKEFSFNLVGTAALAKGGTGDLLAGLLCSLLAQTRGNNVLRAMQAACLWMAMAARKTQRKIYLPSIISSDVVNALGNIPELMMD